MSTAYTILISSIDDFNSPVSLQIVNEDDIHRSISVILSSTTVTPPPSGSTYTILTVSTTSSTPKKEHEITLSAKGDGTTRTETVIVDVTSKSTFAIEVSPFSRTIGLDSSKEFEVRVTSLGTFDDEVELDIDRVPFGVSYEFVPKEVEPEKGTSVISTLTVYVSDETDPNVYALVIRGSESARARAYEDEFAFVVVDVPAKTEFELTVTPTEQTIEISESASFIIETKSIGGFKSDINLDLIALPEGIDFSFDPQTITPTPVESESSTLKLTVTTDASSGDYDVDIKGVSTDVEKTVTIKLTLTKIPTTLTCRPLLSAVRKGDAISVSGEISKSIEGATIKVIYARPDRSQFTRFVTTDSEGQYSDKYEPDLTGLERSTYIGAWEVYAEWDGTSTYDGATSSIATFNLVEPTFLERYGLTWLVDYALYVYIFIAFVVVVVAIAIYGYKKIPPEKRITPLPPERAEAPPLKERAIERIVERPLEKPIERVTERIVERPVEAPPKPIKKGKAPSLILLRKKCFNCSEVISGQAKFCDKCRAPQPKRIEKKYQAPPLVLSRKYCSNCGAIISTKVKFCDKCRAPQKG